MTDDHALDRAMKDFYGTDDISTRIPNSTKPLTSKKEKQVMTTQQPTKKELNAELTKFMGGYTAAILKYKTTKELAAELKSFGKNENPATKSVTKSAPVKKNSGQKVTDVIADVLTGKFLTADQIVAAVVKKNSNQDEGSLSRTVSRHLKAMQTKYNVITDEVAGKKGDKPTKKYSITPR